jgi:hypothetical protein
MAYDYKKITDHEEHDSNPFLEKFLQEAPPIKKRLQFVGNNARAAIAHQVVNPNTNEVDAEAVFMKYVKVDEEKFTKLYLSRFSDFWDLSKAAIRVFGYCMHILKPHSDKILFDMEDCLEYTKYKQRNAVNSGLSDLIEKGVLARSKKSYLLYINPLIFFNGDRIYFAECYVRDRKKSQQIDERQLDLFKHYGISRGLLQNEKEYLENQMNEADKVVPPYKHTERRTRQQPNYDPENGEIING